MNYELPDQLNERLKNTLSEDEKILWAGRPEFLPFVLSELIFCSIPILLGLIGMSMALTFRPNAISETGIWVAALVLILISSYPLVIKLFAHKNMVYALTDKRIIMCGGIFRVRCNSFQHEEISSAEIKDNVIERFFYSGTIRFFAGKMKIEENGMTRIYDKWEAIPMPAKILAIVNATTASFKSRRKNQVHKTRENQTVN